MRRAVVMAFLALVAFCHPVWSDAADEKPRTIITTDGEIDDVDSFIRMLLMSNEFDIAGLVYSSSMFHYKGDGRGSLFQSSMPLVAKRYGERTQLRWVGTDWMQELIAAYAEVYPVLSTHAPGYPTPAYLLEHIAVGNIEFEGEMEKDTAGSDLIKKALLDQTSGPLYLQAWGGTNTIARALKSIEENFKGTQQWQHIYQKVSDKAVIYIILDQDPTYENYISKAWPDVTVYINTVQFGALAYWWKSAVPKGLHSYLQGDFMHQHIINDHGALTRHYYSWGDGQRQTGDDFHTHGDPAQLDKSNGGPFGQYDFISEGDSPAFLHLIDVGLDNLNNPEYGGWSGRLRKRSSVPALWKDGDLEFSETFRQVNTEKDLNPFSGQPDSHFPQSRWIEALQNEFAARADWCVEPFDVANHPPKVAVRQNKRMTVQPGHEIRLDALGTDPDGDPLTFRWWQYAEAGSYPGTVLISGAKTAKATLRVPDDLREGQSIHVVLEVTDAGVHPLTRYQRVILLGEKSAL